MNHKCKNMTNSVLKHSFSSRFIALLFSLVVLISSFCLQSPLVRVASASDQPVMIQAGHADFGPTLINNKWKIKIRDDSGDEPVWRDPENVVFRLGNNSIIPMPDDSTYSFIGENPGTKLYVIPQTQNPDVVWLGWNTQEGGVLNELDRGANLSLEAVSGPGKLHVYLENGNNAPQQLWDSTKGYPQNTWIETNAHTHVNWVFSKPGIYHVKLTFSGKLKNGRAVSDTRVLNFAVGEGTDPNAALSEASDDSDDQGQDEESQDEDNSEGTDGDASEEDAHQNGKHSSKHSLKHSSKKSANSDDTAVILQFVGIIVAIIAVIIVLFIVIAVVKSKKARKQALEKQVLSQKTRDNYSQQHTQSTLNAENNLSDLVKDQPTTVMTPIKPNQGNE